MITKDLTRQLRSLRCCHLPAEPKPLAPSPRPSGAYIPQLAAALEDDLNLTDGARRCARKLAEYVYRRNRAGRRSAITVTYLMKGLRKSRRTVQRYLRELERAGYIGVHVIHARTRMCAGLMVELLAPLFPRHGWPQKLMKPDAPDLSHNDRFRYKTRLIPRALWAAKCCEAVWQRYMKMVPPLPAFPITF